MNELIDRANQYFSRHYNLFYPNIVFERGDGVYIYDTNGNRYIDATSGESFFNLGRNHPDIMQAMTEEQQKGLISICGCNFMHLPQINLARALVHKMPLQHLWKVFFTNSGTESIEGAMKLAMYVTMRPRFISFNGAFHGRTLGALKLTHSNPIQYKGFFLGFPAVHVEFGDNEALWHLEQALNWSIEHFEKFAAVVVEPIQGYGGINVAPPGFLKKVRALCDQFGMLMIIDEIQTGLGRTGKFWAFEHDEIVPDIVCTAKSLGSGLPLGAVIAKQELMDTWEPGSHGSSGGGNSIACAAGEKLVSLIDESLLKRVTSVGNWFIQKLQCRLYPYLVTGRGFMVGIEFKNTEMRERVMQEAAKCGLVMLKASRNFKNSSVRLIPPLNTPESVLEEMVNILCESVRSSDK